MTAVWSGFSSTYPGEGVSRRTPPLRQWRWRSTRKASALACLLLAPLAGAADALDVPGSYPTVQAALDVAGPGGTVQVATGVYLEKIVFPSSGSAGGGFITVQPAPGATPVLDGTGVTGSDMVLIPSRSWVRRVGFEIRNNLGVDDGSGVRITGTGSHIEIRSNRIHNMLGFGAMGMTVYGTEPDIDGEPRIGGLAVDAGADELHPGLVFSDGFESGDTSAWSATIG